MVKRSAGANLLRMMRHSGRLRLGFGGRSVNPHRGAEGGACFSPWVWSFRGFRAALLGRVPKKSALTDHSVLGEIESVWSIFVWCVPCQESETVSGVKRF